MTTWARKVCQLQCSFSRNNDALNHRQIRVMLSSMWRGMGRTKRMFTKVLFIAFVRASLFSITLHFSMRCIFKESTAHLFMYAIRIHSFVQPNKRATRKASPQALHRTKIIGKTHFITSLHACKIPLCAAYHWKMKTHTHTKRAAWKTAQQNLKKKYSFYCGNKWLNNWNVQKFFFQLSIWWVKLKNPFHDDDNNQLRKWNLRSVFQQQQQQLFTCTVRNVSF